ncbi:MAG: phosphoglycerate dehydrogenase [Dehalococcoidia bacterium]|nr:phosphoglycerate dehydrogenase [Dehalococcoidia bacterium]
MTANRPRILVAESVAEDAIEILKTAGDVDIKKGLPPEELKAILGDYDALVVRSQTKVTADLLEGGTKLRIIGRPGVGVDNIDVAAASARGIIVVNSPLGNTVSTAEHTIAMLMSMVRQIPLAYSELKGGTWNRSLKGIELRNKTLGIVGLGKIGTQVAGMALGLKMQVIAYDPFVSQEMADRLGVKMMELDDLLKEADFVTLHMPLTPNTEKLIDASKLALMKKSAMLVNCARGKLVDEQALYDALEAGTIAGAAVDVYSAEPATDNIIVKSNKVVVTPHLAASTVEAERGAGTDVAKQVRDVLMGLPPATPVNAPIIPAEHMAILNPFMAVASKLGQITAGMMEGQAQELTIVYQGEIATVSTLPLKVEILNALLGTESEGRITLTNADAIAKDRGLRVKEETDPSEGTYANSLSLEVMTTKGTASISGTAFQGRAYLTSINGFTLQIEPQDVAMLFTEHMDKPGMIGLVGSVMGNNSINISQMQVSLSSKTPGTAMMALCLGQELPAEVYKQVLAIEGMLKAKVVVLR